MKTRRGPKSAETAEEIRFAGPPTKKPVTTISMQLINTLFGESEKNGA